MLQAPTPRSSMVIRWPIRLLRDGDVIRLGSTVELEFRQPSPVSTTARLIDRQPPSPAHGRRWRVADGRDVYHRR